MIGLWLRTEWRRRWRAIVLMGVLAGATAGLAMAAVDGARRSATVLDRVAVATKQPDVLVLPSRPNFDWSKIAKLPEVKAIGYFGVTQGLGAVGLSVPGQPSGFPPVGPAIGRDVDVIRVDQGRPLDPKNPHEVLVTAAAVRFLHLHIGQSFDVAGPTMTQILDSSEGMDATLASEPKTRVHIVGISAHDSLWDRYLGGSGRADDPQNVGLIMSNALVDHVDYGYLANALVRLRHGAADVARFRQDIVRVTHDATIPVRDLSEDRARFGRALTIERTALLLFALAVVAAGIVLIGQALARLVQASAGDAQSLSGLGATRSQAVRALTGPAFIVAAVAALSSAGVMVALSPRFPIGLARGIELQLGVHVDALVLVVGMVGVALAVVLGGAAGAWFVVSPRPQPTGRSTVARLITALHLPLPAEFGARLALIRGRGRSAVPVRPALVAAMAGVLGIVGAFTFRSGLDHAVSNVALGGTTWQRVAYLQGDGSTAANVSETPLPDLSRVPGLRAAAEVLRTGVDVGGDTVSAWSYRPVLGQIRRVLTSGRAPVGPDEMMVGWQTAQKTHAELGSVVRVNGTPMKVVGIGFLPEQEGHSAYDQGLWMSPEALTKVRRQEIDDRELLADFRGARLHIPPTVAELTGQDRQTRVLAKALGAASIAIEPATAPAAMSNLSSVRGLPIALGVFLIVLAIGALGHALVSSVARRRHDLAVLRSLGVTARQSRSMIAVHATVVGIAGLVVGIPLGLLVGRSTWRWVADTVPFLYVAPLALIAAALAVPAALAVANLVAAAPARSASRVRPAEILRAE